MKRSNARAKRDTSVRFDQADVGEGYKKETRWQKAEETPNI